jgi:hypothetical protein
VANLDAIFFRITNSDGRPRAGSLAIYAEGTSNLSTVYSEKTLVTTQTNPVPADAGGKLPAIFLAAATYKVIAYDEDGATILYENDHYVVPDLSGLTVISFPVVGKSADFTIGSSDYGKVFEVDASAGAVTVTCQALTRGNGFPAFINKKDSSANAVTLSAAVGETFNGGNSTYQLTQQNQTVGIVSEGAAGWRIFVSPSPTATPIRPQGRLTLTTGLPVLAADVTAATTLYYTASDGNYFPLWDGTSWQVRQFPADLSLALDNNSGHTGYHQANKLFDVFTADDGGTTRFGTGPAWTAGAVAGAVGNYVSAGTLTTSTAARGTGAGSTELARINGVWANANTMTLRYGSASGNTVSIAAGKATYLGTIWIDATDGQITCHLAYGQNRKWGVWNAYNRVPIELIAGDSTATWTYGTNTLRKSNNAGGNSVTVLCGLPEEPVLSRFKQYLSNTSSDVLTQIAIGAGSFTAASGVTGSYRIGVTASISTPAATLDAEYRQLPFIGLQSFSCLEQVNGTNQTFNGTNPNMQLSALYRA